ncbi:MAG: metallophosphoesterase family protein [Thermoanaerobaculia bacterium]|nr:metallophosphoesterase family protein [Thermoanaerobaculia bacterium]
MSPNRPGSLLPRLLAASSLLLSLPVLGATPTVTQILGQPTDRSITVAARSDAAVELYFEYGTSSGSYESRTATMATTPDPNLSGFHVAQAVLSGLESNTRYWFRMQSRTAGSSEPFTPSTERTFHTQRAAGNSFVFCVQGDSHPERASSMFSADLYSQTLRAVASEQPDFYVLSGDDFSVDTLPTPYTVASVSGRYTLQLPWLNLLSSPLFLVTGNHEQTSLFNYNQAPDSTNADKVATWAQNARNLYYPLPAPNDAVTGTFYSGNATSLPGIGLLRDYYAFRWGDALFVVIDPYWSSPAQVDNGLGNGHDTPNDKTSDKWLITHGDAQYEWLKTTLEKSDAKWKFVFAHHVLGTGRGGIEIADEYEWGGKNADGSPGFASHRPRWSFPIHDLMARTNVTVFFQAHDHLFARQRLDGVTYQSVPNPADFTYTAFNSASYKSGDVLPNSGYLRVTVSSSGVKVEYVREYLPKDESATQKSGTVAFAYTIGSSTPPPPVVANWILPSSARAPGDAGATWTTDLFVANTGSAEATLGLKFLGHNVDGRSGVEKSFTLGGGQATTWADILGSVFSLSTDWGAIRVSSSSPSLLVSGQTWTPDSTAGTYGQNVPAFGDSDLIRAGTAKTILGVREDALFRTNLILANATDAALDVDVALLADSGETLGSGRIALLPLGMTQVTRVVRELGITAAVAGARLLVSTPTTSGAFAAYASVIDAATNDPRALLPR